MRTALMVFGRFQPPTKGHEALFNKIWELFYGNKIDCEYIFISPTEDNKKNPLSLKYRYQLLQKIFPQNNFIADPNIKNPFDAICELGKYGFKRVFVLSGPDRLEKYRTLEKYIQHPDPEKCIPNIKELNFIPFGFRDKNSNDLIEKISASQARQAVKDKDFVLFSQLIPSCNLEDQIQLYINIRKGLVLNAITTRITSKF